MPLPQITTPEFTTILPSTGERLSFRPFLVKEEKILLMAQEGKDKNEIQRAVINILEECIKTPVTIEDLPLFDIEWLFIQLRSKSVGEVIDLKIKHVENKECLHLNPIEVNLEELEMTKDPNHTNIINITDDVGVTMSIILVLVFFSSFIITQIFVDDVQSKRAIRIEALLQNGAMGFVVGALIFSEIKYLIPITIYALLQYCFLLFYLGNMKIKK